MDGRIDGDKIQDVIEQEKPLMGSQIDMTTFYRLEAQVLEFNNKLNFIEKEMKIKGFDPQLKDQLVCIMRNIRRLQEFKIKGQKIRAIMNWVSEGDKGTKYFF